MCMSVIIGDGLQHYTKQNAGNFQTLVTFNSNVKHNIVPIKSNKPKS